MNIMIINHYAGSPEMGMEFRPYYFAREWVKMGHRVDIIAADYSHLRRVNPEVKRDFQEEIIDGIHYHWIKTARYDQNGVKRALSMAQFVGKLWVHTKKIIREMSPDAVICSSTYPLDTYVGQRIRRKSRKRVKLVHEVHDMWPATLYELGGMSKKHPFVVAMQIAENSAYRHSDKVVSLLPYAEGYMRKHGLKGGKFICIPNGVVEEEWENPEPLSKDHADFLRKLREKGSFIVGYFGGHALSNALDVMLDVAKNSGDKTIQFVLVGDGVEKKRLIERTKREKISNVSFLPPIPKAEIPSLCEFFDCIFYCGMPSPLYRFGVCLNKMFDAMRAGKPNVCALPIEHSYIEKYRCGVCVNPDNLLSVLEGIYKIKGMSIQEQKQMGENGMEAALRFFNYQKLSKKFLKNIQ